MSVKTNVKDRGEKRIRADLKLADNSFVTVGVHYGAGEYTTGKNPPSVAQVAFWMEFGTSSGIPARPAISSAIITNRRKIQAIQSKVLASVMDGSMSVRKGLSIVGFKIESLIKNRINEATSWAEPNAPSTTAAKKRGGALRGASPLIMSGLLFRSVTNEVVVR